MTRRLPTRGAPRLRASPALVEPGFRCDVVVRRLAVRTPPGRSCELDADRRRRRCRRRPRRAQQLPALVAQAQAERRRFGEAGLRDRCGRVRLREHAKIRDRPALLADARADRHVDDAGARRAAGRRPARSPRPSCRRRRTRASRPGRRRRRCATRALEAPARARCSESRAARVPGAAADAHQASVAAARVAVAGGDEVTQDRGAGRRHALAGDAVVAPGIAFEERARRGRGHRQQSVRGAHVTAAQRQRRMRSSARPPALPRCSRPRRRPSANPSRRARGNARRRRRVPCTCASASASSASSASACSRVAADKRASASRWRSSRIRRARVIVRMPRRCVRAGARRGCEAIGVSAGVGVTPKRRARKPPVVDSEKAAPAAPAGWTAASSASISGFERRQRIDHRGDEHVAGEAAHEIEVNRERRGRRQVGAFQPTTGTTYGPSGITATAESSERASAAATAASTDSIVSTPVRLRSSSSSPVV